MNKDRDAALDRLLPGTLAAKASAAPGDSCLDVETLAAWADGALDARERTAVEAHAADCARCQTMLATMVKTMPEPVAARSPWRIPALGWLVPLTAAAAALAIWVAVPRREAVQLSQSAETAVDQVAPLRAPASPAPASAASEPSAAPARAKASTESAPQVQSANERDAAAPMQRSADLEDRRDLTALDKKVAEAPAAPSPIDAAAAGRREVAGAAPAAARLSAFANQAETVIVSSNPATRFKLLPGGGVQRSADGGATWRTEVTGATATLTTGASPSPSVCWLIGPAGTVILSTDGRSWRRLAFPEAVDLIAITASDGEAATVSTLDGRSFATEDGGQTWARTPGF